MSAARSLVLMLAIITLPSLVGCSMSMNAGPRPMAARPYGMYSTPTAGIQPMGTQTVNGPVAVAPGTTAFIPAAIPTVVASAPVGSPGVASATSPNAPLAASAGQNGVITYFNVRPGDTVASVAKLYGMTPEQLRQANKIERTADISAGQQLLIPNTVIR